MTDAAKIFALEKEIGGETPLSISVDCTLFFFPPHKSEISVFQKLLHCSFWRWKPPKTRVLEGLFREKVQADSLKTLDNCGSVTWYLRESVFTDEWPCGCPQPAGTMLSHPWHVLVCTTAVLHQKLSAILSESCWQLIVSLSEFVSIYGFYREKAAAES